MRSLLQRLGFRLTLSGAHFATTLLIAAMLFGIVYFIWYPAPLFDLSAGKNLFLLVVAVDVVLGPMLTLVVADPRKSRRELTRDVGMIALVQFSALAYGVHVVAQSRPAFIVYNAGQFNVVNANDVDPAELSRANPPFNKLPWAGPRLVGAPMPTDADERAETMFSALSGRGDVFHMPRYYVPYEAVAAEIAGKAMDTKALNAVVAIDQARQRELKAEEGEIGYLPFVVRRHVAAAAVSRVNGRFVGIRQLENADE